VSYTVRRGLFDKPATWRLDGETLIESRDGKDKAWPLADLRVARLVAGTNRYVPGERILRLSFRKGGVAIGSHSVVGVAQYRDQGEAFSDLVREVCGRAGVAAPAARFEGGANRGAGLFVGAAAILGCGIVLVLLGAVAARQWALGAELMSRFVFVLFLMLAVAPWLPGAQARKFDPRSVPEDLLP
jgi:hypothetical protein